MLTSRRRRNRTVFRTVDDALECVRNTYNSNVTWSIPLDLFSTAIRFRLK
jgi:hypothetical protein